MIKRFLALSTWRKWFSSEESLLNRPTLQNMDRIFLIRKSELLDDQVSIERNDWSGRRKIFAVRTVDEKDDTKVFI